MKRLVICLALLVTISSLVHATPSPFLSIDDGAFGVRHTSIAIRVWQYGSSPGWANVYLTAQGLSSQQVASSSYSWMQGPSNHWYCVDLNSFQGLSAWDFYDTAAMTQPFGEPAGNYGTIEGLRRAAWLIDTHHDTANNATLRAALQLAVWEAVYDNGATLDITSGVFITENFSNQTVIGQAESWYAASYGRSGRGVYAVDGQNLLGRTEIPEPSTLILLGLGLTAAGIGVVRRRRKS